LHTTKEQKEVLTLTSTKVLVHRLLKRRSSEKENTCTKENF
jgi:hypothetical protein